MLPFRFDEELFDYLESLNTKAHKYFTITKENQRTESLIYIIKAMSLY